mmetsp:Transcript_39676/g.105083  ORF Transcript_39676/g.105083 Transcript_39676/m.105083 type:complete len:130 (-) Transcript_39676:71-460(-)|eukprot:CAMPEP_0194491832 /NCGR_PEP_ID=MMETSP0253-20130528/10589_1 /TAXON_ID=2966 /ORGANISM="Noctiluca scintillans" /LENGTH=129 /DNA_ID=CAMNT_0039332619 /DNA_START=85 /DNA_END=474 /DNA_ORIENTATION=+
MGATFGSVAELWDRVLPVLESVVEKPRALLSPVLLSPSRLPVALLIATLGIGAAVTLRRVGLKEPESEDTFDVPAAVHELPHEPVFIEPRTKTVTPHRAVTPRSATPRDEPPTRDDLFFNILEAYGEVS